MTGEWLAYMRRLHEYLQEQNDALRGMQRELRELREEWQAFRRQGGQPVKHEYRFDLLKVEHLQGNLHIGIKPDAGETALDELVAENDAVPLSPSPHEEDEPFRTIRRNIGEYFKQEAAEALKAMETKRASPLDDAMRSMILADVEKQIGGRIRHYLRQSDKASAAAGDLEREITDKVKRDILATFDAFLQQWNGGEPG